MVQLRGIAVWYSCVVQLCGIAVWYSCVVQLCGTAAWYGSCSDQFEAKLADIACGVCVPFLVHSQYLIVATGDDSSTIGSAIGIGKVPDQRQNVNYRPCD